MKLDDYSVSWSSRMKKDLTKSSSADTTVFFLEFRLGVGRYCRRIGDASRCIRFIVSVTEMQDNSIQNRLDIIQQPKPIDKYYCKRKNCLANLSSMCPCQLCATNRFCSFEQNVVWPPKDLLAVDPNLFRH